MTLHCNIVHIINIVFSAALLYLGCVNVPLWFNMLRYSIFPNVSDIKISAAHFANGGGVVYMASRQEIQFFRPAVVTFTQIFFSSPEHHLTLLHPFLPLMLDPTSQHDDYLRRNHQHALQVARLRSQMVWNVCVVSICVRWCVSYKIWQLDNLGIKYRCKNTPVWVP